MQNKEQATTPLAAIPGDSEVDEIIEEAERALESLPARELHALALYIRDIQRYPLLTKEQEKQLGEHAWSGDEEAQAALVRHNLRFVISQAKRYRSHRVSLDELVQEGNLGLIRASQKFDPDRGTRFITYAVWWIRQAIRSHLHKERPVHVPPSRSSDLDRIRRYVRECRKEGRLPTEADIARDVELSPGVVRDLLAADQAEMSLDAPLGQEGRSLSEVLPAPFDLDAATEKAERRARLDTALGAIRPRDARILRMSYGVGTREHTLGEAGEVEGISRERVRQLRDRGLREARQLASA